jgi:DNA-binding CsgD family transcriptional regulator
VHLPDTWEDVILLCVPVRGADGSVMGVCGFELSALYFQLTYPATETEYGPMIAVLAPEEDGAVCTADGISGGDDGLLGDTELLAAGKGEGLATFTAEKTSFVGTAQEMKLPSAPDSAGEQWTLLTLLPKADYEAYARSSRIGPIAASLGFLLVMLAVSFLLSVKYVRPIVSGLEAVQTSGGETPGNTGIAEIDELYRFLRNRAEPGQMTVDGLPAGIKAMFDSFIQHSYTLTDAERTIFLYYIDGVQIQDIPDLIYTSMSTVRKHNRSIYDKLGVAGKDEMMLYIELIRRCGRLQELYDVPPGKK